MTEPAALPWWRYGHVWMVVSGPAVVVVAGFITLYLAVDGADPLVNTPGTQSQSQPQPSAATQAAPAAPSAEATSPATDAMAPAIQGRNHAATGVPTKP